MIRFELTTIVKFCVPITDLNNGTLYFVAEYTIVLIGCKLVLSCDDVCMSKA